MKTARAKKIFAKAATYILLAVMLLSLVFGGCKDLEKSESYDGMTVKPFGAVGESELELQKRDFEFTVGDFPRVFSSADELKDFDSKLRVEYTLFNPADESVTQTFRVNFGRLPEYTNAEWAREIAALYSVTANDMPVELTLDDKNKYSEYSLTLEPGETVTNVMIIPVFPDMNGDYAPYLYDYSCDFRAGGFGKTAETTVTLKTPYKLQYEYGFECTEEGVYKRKWDSDSQIFKLFSLSVNGAKDVEVENCSNALSRMLFNFLIIEVLSIILLCLLVGAAVGATVGLIVFVCRKLITKAKNKKK